MIAKCIAVLAIVAQINASVCNREAVVVPTCGSDVSGSSVVLGSSGVSGGFSAGAGVPAFSAGTGATVKNVVANGKYPVALRNCGPNPDPRVPVTTSAVRAPLQEKPTIRLPCKIPAPRTVSHTCTCYKTVLRPRVHQQIITVPSVQRYIQTTHRPVIENIQYEAIPVNCCDESSAASSLSGSSVQLVGQEASAVQVPQVAAVEVPQVQTVAVPQVQSVQVPEVQTVQIPQAVQTVAVPQVQSVSVPEYQTVQIPQSVSINSCNSC